MYTGTTPKLKFTFTDFDPSACSKVLVTFSVNGQPFLEVSGSSLTVDSNSVTLKLTQAQSLSFPIGNVKVQLNFMLNSSTRAATDIKTINIWQNLHPSAMTTS